MDKGGTLKCNGISEQMARRGERMESDSRSDISGVMCALAIGCGAWAIARDEVKRSSTLVRIWYGESVVTSRHQQQADA